MHTATVNTAFSGTPDTTGITSAIATAKVIPTTTVTRTATATTTTKKNILPAEMFSDTESDLEEECDEACRREVMGTDKYCHHGARFCKQCQAVS